MERTRISIKQIADVIDHSLLRPDITVKELIEGCALASEYECISVCVRPSDMPVVAKELKGTRVLPTTVIAFPHGTATVETKVFETVDAVSKGAVEVDMVMNYARFLSGEYGYVEEEIAKVARAAHDGGALLKVIFENYYLNHEQIIACCGLSKRAGADFIKTSTGYAPGGAVLDDLEIMVAHAEGMMVKAAGGVKDLDFVLDIIATGTKRIGTRATKEIMMEAMRRERDGTLFYNQR